MVNGKTSSGFTRTSGGTSSGGMGSSRAVTPGRIPASRYGRGGGYVEPGVDPTVERGRAFTSPDLFSWGSRHNAEDIEAPRKKLKIPLRAFGPSLAESRDSRSGVRARFTNYFAFPRENKVIWRDDHDQVPRNRRRFLIFISLVVLYTLWQLGR